MVRVEYDRGKTLLVGAFFGVVALLFLWIFLSPEDFSNIRRARWLTSGFGRAAVLPLFLACSGFLALRAGMLAIGDGVALELTPTHLRLNGYWGRKQVRWSDVRGAALEMNTGQAQLAVATRTAGDFGNGRIRLPLGLARLSEVQMAELIFTIEERCNAAQGAAPGHVDMPAAPTPAAPVRPTFGRKQV